MKTRTGAAYRRCPGGPRAAALVVAAVLGAASCRAPESEFATLTVSQGEGRPPDGEVATAIRREFALDPSIRDASITIHVTEGIASLEGSARSLLQRERATLIAEAVRGVRAVSNRIRVEPTPMIADDELTADVRRALSDDPALAGLPLHARADGGRATLTGTVHSPSELGMAERVAKGVRGVTEVVNRIEVQLRAPRPDSEVVRDARERLRWDALVHHAGIQVAISDGVVTLRGAVGSAAEKRRAIRDAWVLGAKGVDASGLSVEFRTWTGDFRRPPELVPSDGAIESAIIDALAYDPRVAADDVAVLVRDHVATLRGTVADVRARAVATRLARDTVGVVAVRNQLRVGAPPRSDLEVQGAVARALRLDPYTMPFPLDVEVIAGVAVLRGHVENCYQKAEATEVANGVPGVAVVENHIQAPDSAGRCIERSYGDLELPYARYPLATYTYSDRGETKSDAQLQRDIRLELTWNALLDPSEINVDVDQGEAILRGTVHTWGQRRAATASALAAGATQVENRIQVQ